MSNRRVLDPLEEAANQRLTNPWSDIEKCIFLDRFLQHPKDFRKISSFLKNKSVHDCISFYYDSKQSVPYKRALKEHSKRKKRRGDSLKWEATIQAAISVGARVQLGISSEKPLIFELPHDDLTSVTRHFHPMGNEIFDVVFGRHSPSIEIGSMQEVKKTSNKRKASAAMDLFTLEASKRKFLRSHSDNSVKHSGSGSDIDNEKVRQKANSPTVHENIKTQKNDTTKKIPQKWSAEEKTKFYETYEKVEKNWDLLSEAIGTKTVSQVKKFYRDNKKQIQKHRTRAKLSSNSSEDRLRSNDTSPVPEAKENQPVQSNSTATESEPRKVRHGFAQENVSEIQSQREAVDVGLKNQSNQGQPEQWVNDDQQRQLAFAIEQQRHEQHIAERQRLNELSHHQQQQQQQLLEYHHQLRQQKELERQRQVSEYHRRSQIQNLINQSNYFAAQARQHQSYQDYYEGGKSFSL